MPLYRFECPEHGEFSKLTTTDTTKVQCKKCASWCQKIASTPVTRGRTVESENDRSVIMDEEKLDERVKNDVGVAWDLSNKSRQARLEAEKNLPREEVERRKKDVEYRKKVQEVMENEPDEDLEKAGVKQWRREDKHLEKMREKYGDDVKIEKKVP